MAKVNRGTKKNPIIFCGNNALDPRLTKGTAVVGTPRACFKKGFGGGYYGPVDKAFKGPYAPLMENKLHCGARPPRGKVRATLSQCVQQGWGVGAAKRANESGAPPEGGSAFLSGGAPESNPAASSTLVIDVPLIAIVLLVGEFTALYYGKPKFIMTTDENGKDVINWKKMMIAFGAGAGVILLLLLGLTHIIK